MKHSKFSFFSFIVVVGSLLFFACNDGTYPDPCEGKFCANGAECVDGECICPEGWTGDLCDAEITPSSIELRSILLTSYPEKNPNGNPWDRDTTGPDIFITIYEAVGTALQERYKSKVAMDLDSTLIYYELDGENALIEAPSNLHALVVSDQDDSTNQTIGQISFVPYTNGTSFEDTVYLESADRQTKTRLVYKYSW